MDQYYIKNSHDEIISKEDFEKVQKQIRLLGCNYSKRSDHLFSNLIYCNECGYTYGYRVWHQNTNNKSYVYTCNQFRKKPHSIIINLREENLKREIISRLIELSKNANYKTILEKIRTINLDFSNITKEIKVLKKDSKLIEDVSYYSNRIRSNLERITALKVFKNKIKKYANSIEHHIEMCINNNCLTRDLIDFLILKIIPNDKNNITFVLKDGTIL